MKKDIAKALEEIKAYLPTEAEMAEAKKKLEEGPPAPDQDKAAEELGIEDGDWRDGPSDEEWGADEETSHDSNGTA